MRPYVKSRGSARQSTEVDNSSHSDVDESILLETAAKGAAIRFHKLFIIIPN